MTLEEILEQCSYKPGYSLRIQDPDGIKKLVVSAKVYNSRERDDLEETYISMDFAVPTSELPERDWMKFIRFCILSLEVHEIDEWLYYKGERPYDPHV